MLSTNAYSFSQFSYATTAGQRPLTPPGAISWSAPLFARLSSQPALGPRAADAAGYRFGRFHLLPRSRTLLRDGRPVECGSRAFDLLHVLLMARGELVAKEAIVSHVWPTTLVEESNLRFQMASLRKILGPHRDLIKTIPGRGYLLAAEAESD
jgi:DNA-binding response OmpR family regulator